jgi:sugar O-acyltransferase (sialic acid O-acetyltransferase NeuD family)
MLSSINKKGKIHNIVIVGSSGFAKEVYIIIKAINQVKKTWNFIGFIDNNNLDQGVVHGYKVIGNDEYVRNIGDISVVFGVSEPALKRKIVKYYSANSRINYPNIIHPSFLYDEEGVQMGIGNIIAANVVMTTSIQIGDFNIFNINTVVAHDSVISNYVSINPKSNISGNVKIGDDCIIGASSVIHQNTILQKTTTIGMGAVLTRNTKSGCTYFGNPARKIT